MTSHQNLSVSGVMCMNLNHHTLIIVRHKNKLHVPGIIVHVSKSDKTYFGLLYFFC